MRRYPRLVPRLGTGPAHRLTTVILISLRVAEGPRVAGSQYFQSLSMDSHVTHVSPCPLGMEKRTKKDSAEFILQKDSVAHYTSSDSQDWSGTYMLYITPPRLPLTTVARLCPM